MARRSSGLQLPTTKYLEQLPTPDPGPEELTFEHLDVDRLAAQTQVDRDCRYAQKVVRKRKRLFAWAMGRIPEHEREAVRLSLEGKTQREIAEIQSISQNVVHARLKLAQNRLHWLCTVGAKVTARKLQHATNRLLRKEDQRILLAWWETGSQSEAARRVYGNCNKQYQCRESLIRSKTIIGEIGGLWRISMAIESLWENAELRMARPLRKPAGETIDRLSRPTRMEANCCPAGTSTAMTACVSADEKR